MNIEIFENFIREKELEDWKEMYKEKEEAKRHALGCGCPSCAKYAQSAEERWQDEADRVFGSDYNPDHEEDFVANQALKILFRRRPDLQEGFE